MAAMEQYSILGHIGEGAHGIVFKAKQTEVTTPLAALSQLENSRTGRGTRIH